MARPDCRPKSELATSLSLSLFSVPEPGRSRCWHRELAFLSLTESSISGLGRLSRVPQDKGGTAISALLIFFSVNLRHRRRVPSVLDGSEIGGSRAPGQTMPSGCKKDSRIRAADEEKGSCGRP
jgi:hypothetical protein